MYSKTTNALKVWFFNLLQVVFYTLFHNHYRKERRSLIGKTNILNFAEKNPILLRVDYENEGDGMRITRDVELVSFDGVYLKVICRFRRRSYRTFLMKNVHSIRWAGKCFIPAPAPRRIESTAEILKANKNPFLHVTTYDAAKKIHESSGL